MEKQDDRVKAFWDARAGLKEKAGTNDLIAKWLEMRFILEQCQAVLAERKTHNVLDAGCGNGMTLVHLACNVDVSAVGVDFSVDMVKEARTAWRDQHCNSASIVDFQVNNLLEMEPHDFPSKFDFAYTERAIINLLDWKSQEQAIRNVLACVKRGGMFLMVENSADGLAEINAWRSTLGLPFIEAPWHNRYLMESELHFLAGELYLVEKIAELKVTCNYSSTYYFLSRVINAALAAEVGAEPDYLSDVNRLALELPPLRGFLGQGRAWVWRRL